MATPRIYRGRPGPASTGCGCWSKPDSTMDRILIANALYRHSFRRFPVLLDELDSEFSPRRTTHLRTSTGHGYRHTLWPGFDPPNGVRMRTGFRLLAIALLAAGGLLVAPGGPASAVSVPGMVLTSATATLPAELSPLATGKRVQYVSTDVNGNYITATALILTPKSNKKNRIAAWAHGTTGLADQCAPSTSQAVFWPEAQDATAALLTSGFTVAAADYPGLGTVQAHPYLVGVSEARSVIDSVKAARNLDSSLSTNYVLDGHSQGGAAALFANQIASSYDGNLTLKGSASIAPVSGIDMLASMIPGTPIQGYLVMGLYGLQAVDPSFTANNYLAPTAKNKTSVLNTGCLMEILTAYQNLTAGQL